VGTCARCGAFVCEACQWPIARADGSLQTFCVECAARPDVNGAAVFHRESLGVRDGWSWLVGVVGVFAGLAGFVIVTGSTRSDWRPIVAMVGAFSLATICGLFWAGVRQARVALAAHLVVFGAPIAVTSPELIPFLLFPTALVVTALRSTRTKLFFQLDVTPLEVEQAWARRFDNPLARLALTWAVVGVLMPCVAPVGLVLGLVAWRRVDPTATPPVTGRERALGAVLLASLSVLFWLGLALYVGSTR
jgi:hypothetical protein